MTAVTCIRLGLMGSALVRAALASGHGVAVWNRTPGKAQALVDMGALAADTLENAIAASPIMLICKDGHVNEKNDSSGRGEG